MRSGLSLSTAVAACLFRYCAIGVMPGLCFRPTWLTNAKIEAISGPHLSLALHEFVMEQPQPKGSRKAFVISMTIAALVVTLSAAFWLYYQHRLREVPPRPDATQHARVVARLQVAPQPPNTSSAATPEQSPAPMQSPERPQFFPTLDPMEQFRDDLRKALLGDLGTTFPGLERALDVQTLKSNDPSYRQILFQILDAAEKEPPDRRPELLLSADLVAAQLWCAMEDKEGCDQLRHDLARYHLTLQGDVLGGVFVYSRDLLWRLWQDYAETDWGQRAFVLLLDRGWDTSPTCAKGAEQFREVIRQGESFLLQWPNSAQRTVVTFLVAQANVTWWSLSLETVGEMSDYVDPKQYQTGAEDARNKAIAYFDQLEQSAPGTIYGEFARQILPALRGGRSIAGYRFFCVYD